MKYRRFVATELFRTLKVAHSIYLATRMKVLKFLFNSSIRYLPSIYSHLTLSNATGVNKDGTGAQVQRMMAVAALAETLGRPFLQQEIIDVAIHPLDPFQETKQYEAYLRRLNVLFKVDNSINPTVTKKALQIKNLHLRNLLKYALVSAMLKTTTLLEIENPYAVSDLNPDAYKSVSNKLGISRVIHELKTPEPYIAIHYRQGVGGFVTYPGQSIAREMKVAYFKEVIDRFLSKSDFKEAIVHVFTDAPSVKLEFEPPESQQYLWDGSPGYKNGVMQIQPLVFDAESLGVSRVEVHSGGDPIDAIIMMASASLLILGRSSLSYVAGLLNERAVVVPAPLFWHPPLSGWMRT
jgi:hypothetical protein